MSKKKKLKRLETRNHHQLHFSIILKKGSIRIRWLVGRVLPYLLPIHFYIEYLCG
jgi:hypothetical protein